MVQQWKLFEHVLQMLWNQEPNCDAVSALSLSSKQKTLRLAFTAWKRMVKKQLKEMDLSGRVLEEEFRIALKWCYLKVYFNNSRIKINNHNGNEYC